jgi:hypothetical protein
MGQYGYEVARTTLEKRGQSGGPGLGLFSGIGGLRAHWNEMLPALANQDPSFEDSWQRGFKRLHPFWMLQHLSNNAHALLSKDIDARGEGATFGGANAGAQAIEAAIWSLHAGAVDAALVVTYDTLVEPETIVELSHRDATSRASLETLKAPYDINARGFVAGEAAAAALLVLSDDPQLPSIAAKTVADGRRGLPAPSTLDALLGQNECRVVDGCATADPIFEAGECELLATRGIESLCATQGALGQVGAASPLVQALLLSECLRRETLPGIAGLQDARHSIVNSTPTSTTAREALCLSAGAPGLAAATCIQLK